MAAKKNIQLPERQTMMMPTLDDWYPNHTLKDHPSGLVDGVQVSFIELMPYGKYPRKWRVCVWGNDDCGMERDYTDSERTDALAKYNLISSWETVDKYALQMHGFTYC